MRVLSSNTTLSVDFVSKTWLTFFRNSGKLSRSQSQPKIAYNSIYFTSFPSTYCNIQLNLFLPKPTEKFVFFGRNIHLLKRTDSR